MGDRAPIQIGKLKSIIRETPVTVRIHNQLRCRVALHWVDYVGAEKLTPFFTVPKNSMRTKTANAQHAFAVRTMAGDLIQFIMLTAATYQEITITPHTSSIILHESSESDDEVVAGVREVKHRRSSTVVPEPPQWPSIPGVEMRRRHHRAECMHVGCTFTASDLEVERHAAIKSLHMKHFKDPGVECEMCEHLLLTKEWLPPQDEPLVPPPIPFLDAEQLRADGHELRIASIVNPWASSATSLYYKVVCVFNASLLSLPGETVRYTMDVWTPSKDAPQGHAVALTFRDALRAWFCTWSVWDVEAPPCAVLRLRTRGNIRAHVNNPWCMLADIVCPEALCPLRVRKARPPKPRLPEQLTDVPARPCLIDTFVSYRTSPERALVFLSSEDRRLRQDRIDLLTSVPDD